MIMRSLLVALLVLALWALALVFGLTLWIPGAASALVVLALAGHVFYTRWHAARSSRALERALASQADAIEQRARPDRQPALRALSAQFQKSLETLRRSKLAHGRAGALYALPWYVIIGPPGTGKSTAIRQSGLSFPLAGEQDGIRGVGGTRQCDWWLTNEAVLLDTAGRYASADEDREEWFAFLDLLRRSRPRRPLNGLIVAVSAGELATLDGAGVADLGARIRARIDEVMGRLELRLPVYVLLTKCDLLPGFVASFAELRRGERDQVLGFTLPPTAPDGLAASVQRHWSRLVQTLERRALLEAGNVAGVDARRALYGFPQQLELLGPQLSAFLQQAFADNVYRDAPILRGVYLTSGAQEGTPVDRLTGDIASRFGLPKPAPVAGLSGDNKSYFLGDLFRHVMFADRELATQGSAARKRGERGRVALALGLLAASVMFSVASARAYAANRDLIRAAERELALVREPGEQHGTLAALAPLRARLVALHQAARDGAPLHALGLDQSSALLPQLHRAYTSALRAALIQPLVAELERQLAGRSSGPRPGVLSADAQAALFDRTKTYLLLTQPKSADEPALDPTLTEWLANQLAALWSDGQTGPVSMAQRDELGAHLGFYLDLLGSDSSLGFARAREPLVAARAELSRVPPVELALDRIVAGVEPAGFELGLEALVGTTGLPWRARGKVRGAYTRRGWETYVRPLLEDQPHNLIGEAWVSAAHVERDEARMCALRGAYFARYLEEWRTFLGSLQSDEPSDRGGALALLQDFTRGQPAPIERLMRAVADNARLEPEAPATPEAAEGVLDQLRKRVAATPARALLARRDPCAGGKTLTEEGVRRALEGFYGFGVSGEPAVQGAPPPVTSAQIYQEQLAYLRDALQAASEDPTQTEASLARASGVRTRVRSLIEAQPIGWRPRFEALLWPPVQGSSASAANALAGEQARAWCTTVVQPYARTLRDRYPFAKRGQDAALADLADFYRPGTGTLWAFYSASLQRDLPQLGGSFESGRGPGAGTPYNPELPRFLERANALSAALFPPRAEQPRVDLELRVRPAPGIAQVLLTVDGQVVDFHNGPERWVRVTWPGTSERRGASLRVRGDGIDETVMQDGEWGLFRLLESSTIAAQPGERFFSARWRLHTQHDIVVDVRPARAENPLVGPKGLLDVFRGSDVALPRSLAAQSKACRE